MCCADCDRALPHVYEVAGSVKHGSELLPLNTHVSHVLNHAYMPSAISRISREWMANRCCN
jgi:hypothetical protein